jgi:hypothetical protein
MAYPSRPQSDLFTNDHRHAFEALYFDTTSTAVRVGESYAVGQRDTALGTGIRFAMFDLLDSAYNPTSKAQIDASLLESSNQTEAILGYESNGTPRTGVVPNVYMYWGSGAPPGASRARQVLLRFSGVIPESINTVTLVACGQGTVQIYRNGALVVGGKLTEPRARAARSGLTFPTIKTELGYQFNETPINFSAGDAVDIYYWHNGESWGGFGLKAIIGAVTPTTFLSRLRDAAVVGTSLLPASVTPISAQAMPYLIDAKLSLGRRKIPQLTLTVLLTSSDEPTGYRLSRSQGVKVLRDNANPSFTIQRGRMMHLRAGTTLVDGTSDLYPRYVWVIRDIEQQSSGEATITCEGIQSRLADQYDENFPDFLDYHMFGFCLREGATEPVFGVNALDNWPLEYATALLCYRAGIDAMTLGRQVRTTQTLGRRVYRTQGNTVLHRGAPHFSARSLTQSNLVPLERQPNYGNVPPLANDNLPADDPYLFNPEVTRRLYDRVIELTSQLGYDFGETPDGFLHLRGANNATHWQSMNHEITESGPFATYDTVGKTTALSAVGGTVFSRTNADSAWTRQFSGVFSRIDLYVGIGRNAALVNGGRLNVGIERRNAAGTFVPVTSSVISTFVNTTEAYFYDDALRADGTNATVIRLGTFMPDFYRITITPAGVEPGESVCVYRINGVGVYEYDPEASLYSGTDQQQVLSTLGNILAITPQSLAKEQINHVVVVGSRKATVTDSAKFNSTSNNPEQEFHVAVGTDPFSIYDPTAPNFLGGKRMAVIFDEKVSDTDFAYWLVRTLLYRYQAPSKDGGSFEHTALPILEPGDALRVKEEKHTSIDHTLFVDEISESYSLTEATSSVQANPFPSIPSYQPREDLDIDTLFVDPVTGLGMPAINVRISYRNVHNRPVTNPSLSNATRIRSFAARANTSSAPMVSTTLSGGITSLALPHTAIPETIYLSQFTDAGIFATVGNSAGMIRSRGLVNNPYRQFFRISSWVARRPTVQFDFQEGDGTAGLYDTTYYNFPSTDWQINYDHLRLRTTEDLVTQVENPFYDPYSSEVGNLVELAFDQLVNGRVRVSVWASSDAFATDIPVAWLTNPEADPLQDEAHYVYMDAGANKSFLWDGTDAIGLWNTLNSSEWADTVQGSFGEKPNAVGQGFYVWNDRATNTHTFIGDTNLYGGAYPNFNSLGQPEFTIGQFAQFYIKIEVLNDKLIAKDMLPEIGVFSPRVVDTRRLVTANAWNSANASYVWTHLGEPSQVAIRIQDYVKPTPTWAPGTVTIPGDWGAYSTPDQADASFWVGKPVRMTFVPRARRGPIFAALGTNTSVKLTRQVHLKTMTFDQFMTLDGRGYKGPSDTKFEQPPVNVTKKSVTSRMYHNEDHTLEFEDSSYRTGADLSAMEWIFDPAQFKKDFGNGIEEALQFGNYEQLETLPGFNAQRLGGTSIQSQSAMLMGFMTYLFYMSAFSQDRSGRRQWCLNSYTDGANKRGFIDRGKIVTPNWLSASSDPISGNYRPHTIVDYEDKGADRYYARSIFVRQWKEAYWSNPADIRSLAHVSRYNITDTFQRQFLSVPILDFTMDRDSLTTLSSVNTDIWAEQWAINASNASIAVMASPATTGSIIELLPNTVANPLGAARRVNCRPTSFGSWGFNRQAFTDYFYPSPKRDFHPYRKYPFMPDTAYLRPTFTDAGMTLLSATGGMARVMLRDAAASPSWYGYAWATASGLHDRGVVLETSVEEGAGDGVVALRKRGITFPSTAVQWSQVYDYIRGDTTDTWDQFRGVISRGPYNARTGRWDATWAIYDQAINRAAPIQPTKAAGVYLLNSFRYSNYILAPVINSNRDMESKQHWTDRMYEFWDYRFQHEYVWYSERYFPINRFGSAMYMYKGDEFTRLSGRVKYPWVSFTGQNPRIYFDPGAWTGWKPDIPINTITGYATSWTDAPYLRWREVRAIRTRSSPDTVNGVDWYITLTGGEPGLGTGRSQVNRNDHTNPPLSGTYTSPARLHRRANILDEYMNGPGDVRLAVGPDVPEARGLTMHLVLSEKYRGN